MGVYGPDIADALQVYASQFDDLRIAERQPIVDLNAINPLSELREDWQNVDSDETEHRLNLTAGVDEDAYLETDERGQYTAGYEAQAGMGVRVPQNPENDEELRWGYYTVDVNGDPLNGWFFGVDSTDLFVCEVRGGNENRVYRENWSENVADGEDDAETNPSEFGIDLAKGNIFQIEFVYYGYGPVKMEVLTDKGKVTLHKFTHDGTTSVKNTNLPLQQQIEAGGTNNDALELYVGGRQFSIIGSRTQSKRRAGHYVNEITGIDDTQWYPVVSIKLKDGSDIGSIDFRHVLADVLDFSADTDSSSYRWQVRRGTELDTPSWETPTTHVDKQDETACKVDTSATTIDQGNGLTGVVVDAGTLTAGQKNQTDIQANDPSGEIGGDETMTLVIQASPNQSGTVSEMFFNWQERW